MEKQPSVTMVTTNRLSNYSTERYWTLSEIDQCANNVCFLNQLDDVRIESNFVVLYLLWQPKEHLSVMDMLGCIQETVATLKRVRINSEVQELSDSALEIYLVVDKVSASLPLQTNHGGKRNASLLEVDHLLETQAAERLARLTVSDPILRTSISGMCVGVTDQVRAAPGLSEGVLAIVSYGANDRRRAGKRCNPEDVNDIRKSAVTVFARNEGEFLGLDPERETDAVQGIDQSMVRAEWNAQGNHESFACRAHEYWKKHWKFKASVNVDFIIDGELSLFSFENISSMFIVTVLILVTAHIWSTVKQKQLIV